MENRGRWLKFKFCMRGHENVKVAPHLVLESAHRVGDEDLAAGNPGRLRRGIENPPRGSDERVAGQHHRRIRRPPARNHLGCELIERTAPAFGLGLAQGTERLD